CWWSLEPRLSDLVRIGPIPEESKVLLPFSIVTTAAGVFFLLLSFSLIVLNDRDRILNCLSMGRWRRNNDSNNTGELQEEVGNILVGNPLSIRVVYPLEDEDWANGVVCQNAFAERRLEILKRYFESQRRRAAPVEGQTEPFGAASDGNECSSECDDDVPVNECYVCVSRFRRQLIWWPCGHWICASCSRRFLRMSGSSEAACCPNCRGSCRHEELVAVYVVPRDTNQSTENVPVEPVDHIDNV
ncbi:uncharacterized protein TM35_000042370, partial [Trypanosoma theileri]